MGKKKNHSVMKSVKQATKGLKLSHFIILVLLLVFVVGASTVGTVILAAMSGMPSLENNDVTNFNVTSYIVDKDDAFVEKLSPNNTNHVSVDYNEISPNMVKAVVSIEDRRFYNHHGVDPVRITGAMVANIKAGHTVQGGSTITQQLAGLALLDRNEKTYKRKIQEAILAMRIENKYSKEDIITSYLNRCYFGIGISGMSCYGIEAAANDILGKHASELTPNDAALLAGMIQNPSNWSPLNNVENAKVRRGQVLQAMESNGVITKDEMNQYNGEDIETASITEVDTNVKQSFNQSYIDYVIEEALEILDLQRDPTKLYSGGYVIHTSLDQNIQEYAYNYFNNDAYFPGNSYTQTMQGAMVVLNTKNSGVAAMIGGRHLDEGKERSFNRATQAVRQPGSTFKPIFVYGPAFEEGKGTGTVYTDAPYEGYQGHIIKNADLKYRGPVTIRYALQESLNTVAARCIEDIGPEKGMKFAKKCGITSLVEDKDGANDFTISAGLGGLTEGVSVLEMAGAYGAFANEGMYTKPHAITKITTEEGDIIWKQKPESHRAMSEQTAYMMTSCLQSVITSGLGANAAIYDGRATAGKTGTTDNAKDIWFCGYTPQYVAAVWMGFDQPEAMYSSSDVPAMAFGNIMSYAHQGLEFENFERPDDLVDVLVDFKNGNLATRSTPYRYRANELFKAGTEPTTYSNNIYPYSQYENSRNQVQQQTPAQQQTQTDTQTNTNTQTNNQYQQGATQQQPQGGYNTGGTGTQQGNNTANAAGTGG